MDVVLAVFFAALLFVPIALIIWAVLRAVRHRNVWIEGGAELPWARSPCEPRVLGAVTPRLRRYGYRLESQGQGSIVFAKSYRPIWLLVPCLLFFPLGLLSLIYTKTAFLNFTVRSDAPGASYVGFSGSGPSRLRGELNADLDGSAAGAVPGR